jgi:hypothetical protein
MASSGFIWAVNGGTDVVILPDPRAAYRRQSLIGTSWNEVRLGILYTWVPSVSSDAACSTEAITAASCLDWFTLGLKDDSDTAPGRAGSTFIGFCFPGTTATYTVTVNSNASGTANLQTSSNHSYVASINGTSLLSTDNIDATLTIQYPIFSTGNVCAFLALKLVVNNAGLSNQTVTPSVNTTTGPATDLSVNNIRSLLFSSTYTAFSALTWNSGGVALALPSDFYVRAPFNNNRIRLSCHEVLKIS